MNGGRLCATLRVCGGGDGVWSGMDRRVHPSLGCLGICMMCYWYICGRVLTREAADSSECSPPPRFITCSPKSGPFVQCKLRAVRRVHCWSFHAVAS